ncbi:zinc ribbon domain-containing protein [Thalassotalea castellviae]|uniref:Zinc ribbon domain-containing protein n=1 Tax=Thalassotalea castellviae TaxID=3075612 RepID=A0ABU2ZYT4_9GAMM|nr:zinc ribbon domain-containing protein [Thalassotalea sp. W431]MDT0603086.1 zinc ribbon domain-containing protein [Thalassotalea sp. W431]
MKNNNIFLWGLYLISLCFIAGGVKYSVLLANSTQFTHSEIVNIMVLIPAIIYLLLTIFKIKNKTYQQYFDLDSSEFSQTVLTQQTDFYEKSFSFSLAIAGIYFVIYISNNALITEGLYFIVAIIVSLGIVRNLNKMLAAKLSGGVSVALGLIIVVLFIYLTYLFELQLGVSNQSFLYFFMSFPVSVIAIFLIMIITASAHSFYKVIWRLFQRLAIEYKLVNNSEASSRIALFDLEQYFGFVINKQLFLAILCSPLFFALANYIDIRELTVGWLFLAFFPICFRFSRYVSSLEGIKYFLLLKIMFHYLFWALLILTLFFQLSFFIFCYISQWYVESDYFSNGFLPNFYIALNTWVSNEVLLSQLEGVFYAFLILIQTVYLLAAWSTKQFSRIILQCLTLTAFFTITAYNQTFTANDFSTVQGALFTPAVVLLTLVPIVIDMATQSMKMLKDQRVKCRHCRQPNDAKFNFCQLCGESLLGAVQKIDRETAARLTALIEQLNNQIAHKKYTLTQGLELLNCYIEGLEKVLAITKNNHGKVDLYDKYSSKLKQLVNTSDDTINGDR